MTPENRWKRVVVIGATLLGVCGEFAYAREKSATKKKASDIATKAYRMRMDGKVDKAKQALEQELAKKPKDAAAWFELARVEFQRFGKTHELDSAQKAIERAVNLAPSNPRYHRWAGRIAMLNGILKAHSKNRRAMVEQGKKATKAAEKAVALDPDDHEARMILVWLYGNSPADLGGDKNQAMQHVKELEKRSPVDGAVARCGFTLKGQQEKKIAHWNKVAQKLNRNPRVHENLAREYAWSGNLEKAALHANKALALEPTRGQFLIEVARAFALKKKLKPAEKFARRYLALNPPGPLSLRAWTHAALGVIQQRGGDKEASVKSFKKARELDSYCWFTMTPPPEQLFKAP